VACLPPPQFRAGKTSISEYDLDDLWFGRVLCVYRIRIQTDKDWAANRAAPPGSPLKYTEHDIVLLGTWFPFVPRANERRDGSNLMLCEPSPDPVVYPVPAQDILARVPVVPAGDTGTIPERALDGLGAGRFSDVCKADRAGEPGSGSRLYYVNRWAMDWAIDERVGV
jgi:hypothetical protein